MRQKFIFILIILLIILSGCVSQKNDEAVISSSFSFQSSSSFSSDLIKESTHEEFTWTSMKEAIYFYEDTIVEELGEELANVELEEEFYERESWKFIKNSKDIIILSLKNIGVGGRDVIEFEKGKRNTEITFFHANSPYPKRPTSRWTVRNSDKVKIREETLNPIDPSFVNDEFFESQSLEPADSFTAEDAFAYLKEREGFSDDIVVKYSSYNSDEKYYKLILVSRSLKSQGGSGTVGIYHVYEDKKIVDTYIQ